ncbi:hypothetical protein QM012_009337 [Aureobasidium pullulans]|uniref:Xylanolytic transcriptional activator regulatory domain-containing protein n=1 Tax=Aureobasidium pullulans TaxID=5580 RepID=A0ABR0THN9_AURPU
MPDAWSLDVFEAVFEDLNALTSETIGATTTHQETSTAWPVRRPGVPSHNFSPTNLTLDKPLSNDVAATRGRNQTSSVTILPAQQRARPAMSGRDRQISDASSRSHERPPVTRHISQERRYPVLNPLLPMLRDFMPDTLSFSLLEAYFELWSLHGAPKNLFVPCSVFQKRAFLTQVNPRPTSKVLLASMLWLAAQNADIPLLSSSSGKRKYVRRKLLQLVTNLLKPLSEMAFSGYEGLSDSNAGGTPSQYLDECMAYVHLAMVTSASAFTRASLRWWNMAFSLAREIDLHQPLPNHDGYLSDDAAHSASAQVSPADHTRDTVRETFGKNTFLAEERKRAWWFLYTMDRHISFFFNKPLSLLDSECSSLERPISELSWQSDQKQDATEVGHGPWYYCTGTDFFQFFTPLMALLGETVYFTLAQNHPRFGISLHTTNDWSNWRSAIREKLDDYLRGISTMRDFVERSQRTESVCSQTTDGSAIPAPRYQDPRSVVVFAYAEFLVPVFHIILEGKWDPPTLLDQQDDWLGSTGFKNVLKHAVDAAAPMRELFDLDPGLRFMPFYLGIYLFHVSLPLILVVDRVKQKINDQVITACDTFIRAHEICISQIPSEYSVAMLTVLRAAKMEMQGKIPCDTQENALQRRRLLQKFDWTSEGRGVAA